MPVERAEDEFNGVVKALRQHGVKVAVYDSDPEADTPDALFPNNWVSFHRDGRVGLYPMFAENRRRERRESVLHSLAIDHGLDLNPLWTSPNSNNTESFLEGTGSLILDRVPTSRHTQPLAREPTDKRPAFLRSVWVRTGELHCACRPRVTPLPPFTTRM